MVPLEKTSAPLGAWYLTALTVPGWPGGGVVVRRRPSSWIQELSGAVWTLLELSLTTFAGWWETYCAWVGIASHSQPTSLSPIEVAVFSETPVLRQTRSEANSSAALPAGIVRGKVRASLSPKYITPKSWFSGLSGPTRP